MIKTMIGALALAATVPAAASGSSMVRHDDLNLASPAGMELLERRIGTAARDVCGATGARVMGASEHMQIRSCVADAKAQAARQIAQLDARGARGG